MTRRDDDEDEDDGVLALVMEEREREKGRRETRGDGADSSGAAALLVALSSFSLSPAFASLVCLLYSCSAVVVVVDCCRCFTADCKDVQDSRSDGVDGDKNRRDRSGGCVPSRETRLR